MAKAATSEDYREAVLAALAAVRGEVDAVAAISALTSIIVFTMAGQAKVDQDWIDAWARSISDRIRTETLPVSREMEATWGRGGWAH